MFQKVVIYTDNFIWTTSQVDFRWQRESRGQRKFTESDSKFIIV